ncbi:uncharacterized protein BDV14DRAFT_199557 [Aspergillus stella-maris]|uniref:uncharacterized protein n=1 Tax=Aspergillus stella-maris TaxID=1810926 RepID=UPI003CCCB1B9
MPDPSSLPIELFLYVLDYVAGDAKIPWTLSLVNRGWRSAVTPLVFSRFEFDGNIERIHKLWLLLVVIAHMPRLGTHVRHLVLTTQKKPDELPQFALRLYMSMATFVKSKLAKAGLEHVGDPAMHMARGDNRPMIALILLLCPNIVSLQLHVATVDPYLDAILASAVVRDWDGKTPPMRAFQSLRTLHIATAEAAGYNEQFVPIINAPTRMNKRRPYLRLPRLEELQIVDAQFGVGLDSLPAEDTALSRLTIVFMSQIEYIRPVFQYTTKLTQLSLCLPLNGNGEIRDLQVHQSLWEALCPLKDQLEYLDLYEPELRITPQSDSDPFPKSQNFSYCCPLSNFLKLRQLSITLLLLAGHQCQHEPSTKFINHLPPALESFVLYGCSQNWIFEHIRLLKEEILAITEAKPLLPLNSILICSSPETTIPSAPSEHIRGICKEKRIMFTTVDFGLVYQGGSLTDFARTTHKSQPDLDDIVYGPRDFDKNHKSWNIIPKDMTAHGRRGTLDETSFDTAVKPRLDIPRTFIIEQ